MISKEKMSKIFNKKCREP